MTLREALVSLRDESLADLNAAWEYYSHSTNVWRAFQTLVHEGHKFDFKNLATNARVDEADLAKRSQAYVTHDLGDYAVQRFASIFEDFFFDLLRLWLVQCPHSLGRKELTFDLVLQATDKDELVEAIVEKQLNELRYKRVDDWFKYLQDLITLDIPTAGQALQIAELKAARDICLHFRGISNAIYRNKAGARSRAAVGERLVNHEPYLRESWSFLRTTISELSAAVLAKTRGAA